MPKELTFTYDAVEKLPLEKNEHYYLRVPVFYDYNNNANDTVNFIFDTGAYITVITRDTAIKFGFFDRFTIHKNMPLMGFTGRCWADVLEIPGFIIGGRRLEGVKVAVPHDDTDIYNFKLKG